MRNLGMLFFVLASLAQSGCRHQPMEEFTSKEGRFRVLMPGVPQRDDSGSLAERVNKVLLLQRSGSYSVSWEDMEIKKQMSDDERLDAACDGAIKLVKGKAVRKKEITLAGKYPGRDLVIELPESDGVVHDRLYLVGARLYNVLASGPKWWVESSQSRKVLESFELLEE